MIISAICLKLHQKLLTAIQLMEESLPQNFAERLIELQSTLDQQYSMEIIQELNELYRIAIDYYIRQEPRKAKHFQKKMTGLLCNPRTLNIIEEPLKNSKDQNNQTRQNFIKNFKLQAQIKDEVMRFQNFSDQYIKSIIQTSERAIRKNQQLRNVDLNKQQKKLEERILLKRVKSQQKIRMLSPRKLKQQDAL